jgi:DNA-binding ferritin-like protein
MDTRFLNTYLYAIASYKKTAQEMPEEACNLLSTYLAVLRGMFLLHQQNHWDAKRYGSHLLFQRLYEETQDMVDDAGERVVGLCGKILFKGSESGITNKFSTSDNSSTALLESSLKIEKLFQQIAKKTYSELKEKDILTLGLDDLIMSQSSISESHIYLLQQSLKLNT